MFDITAGLHKETFTTIIIDLANQFGLHKAMLEVMQTMQDSRMGLYEFMGRQADKIFLRELMGTEVIPCICPAGYRGTQQGELWFVRILPPVLAPFAYRVIFTTPYVLLSPGKNSWEAYLNRTISDKKTKTTANSLENLMKQGLSEYYWNEYIFQAYVNHKPDVIYLQGLPDVSSSRPHYTDVPKFASILPDSPLSWANSFNRSSKNTITEILTGIVSRVTYHNPATGWSVLRVQPFQSPQQQETVTVHQTKVFAGATMEFRGAWTIDHKYGRQFKATEAIEKKPATTASIEKYLGSGLIKGVGLQTAKKIVRYFQKETLDIFETDIHRLTEVPGIAKKKLKIIEQAWTEHRAIREVMMFLQGHDPVCGAHL